MAFVARGIQCCVPVVQITEAYRDWIDGLRDVAGRARVQVRVDRLVHGNPGKHRALAGGLFELKIDFGPGYGVYYVQRGDRLIVLLVGGDKSTQSQDIKLALALARDL